MCITSKVVKESKVKREVMEHGDSREYHRNDRDGRGYRTEYRRRYDRMDRFRDRFDRMRDDRIDRFRGRFDRMRDDRGDRVDRMRDDHLDRTDRVRDTVEDRGSTDRLRDSRNFREYRREPQTFGDYQSYATRFRSHSRSRSRFDSARDVFSFHVIES